MYQEWKIDSKHSEIGFKIGHLNISSISGFFIEFQGSLKQIHSDSLIDSKIDMRATVRSLNTKNKIRDQHLLSADFFDEEFHKYITFQSEAFQRLDIEHYSVNGVLFIKGTRKDINITAHYTGQTRGLDKEERLGLEISGDLERKLFGIDWMEKNIDGIQVIGDFAHVHSYLELVKI